MSEIFREVDEMMRQERIEKIWQDYGNYIIGFVVAVILITAGVSGFNTWNRHVKMNQTDRVLALLDAPSFPQNVTEADLSDMRAGAQAITRLKAAAAFAEEGDKEQALTLYEAVAKDKSAPADLRELGILMNVRLSAQQEGSNADVMLEQLNSVWRNTSSPWTHYALLEAAAIQANHKDNYAAALEYLQRIKNAENLPPSLYESAQSLQHIYAMRAQQKGTKEE